MLAAVEDATDFYNLASFTGSIQHHFTAANQAPESALYKICFLF